MKPSAVKSGQAMAESRLQTLAADLDQALGHVSAERGRKAAWAACRSAVARVELAHPVIAAAVANQRADNLEAVAALVVELDYEYLRLSEAGKHPSAVLSAFSLARAASAVEYAARGEAAEAVYEAVIATDDIPGIRAVVIHALGNCRSGNRE